MFPERFNLSMVFVSLEPKRTNSIAIYTRNIVTCTNANVLPVNRFFPVTSNSEEGVLLNGRVSGVGDCVVEASVVVGSGTGIVVLSSKSSSAR